MLDRAASAPVAFVNRLFEESNGWTNLGAMLAELCDVFQVRAAGCRWPATGPALLLVETTAVPKPAFQAPMPVLGQTPGLFWADGPPEGTDESLRLVANTLGNSPLMRARLASVFEQERIAQRLEDAGRVAGRVAHDLDNVFQGVTGFAALALETLPSGSMARQNIREVETAAQHGLKFCAQLHLLSRGGHARPLPAAVPTALAKQVERLTRQFPDVRPSVDASKDLPPVALEGGMLQQVLGLLLDNAAEASPKGATVRVSARLVELAPAELPAFLGSPTTGPNVDVTIADNGPGLTDDARRRMFVEPFFTTKFRHRGLSLAVVYRILYAHRGGVQVVDQPGPGTTIRVVLPLAAARVPAIEPGRTTGGSTT